MNTSDVRPLRVGVNLLYLVPGVVGGTEPYATRLLGAIADRGRQAGGDEPDVELVVFALRGFVESHPDVAARFPVITAPVTGRTKALRVAFESSWLVYQAHRQKLDVMHHIGGRVPALCRMPSVVTVHDLQPLDHPENFSLVKRAFLSRAIPRTARRARIVTTPSEFVRRGVVERFGLSDDAVTVVHAPVPLRDSDRLDTPRPAMVGSSPYFVYPAITYVHKNHAVLLEAFARLVEQRPEVRLVLTGGEGPHEPQLRERIAVLGLGSNVVRTGRVSHDELDALFDHAVALVFPSRYEGFGLPVVEAMAAGCPVIAADATALPEVVGGGGRLVHPDDVEGWCDAMAEQLDADRVAAAAAARHRVEVYDAEPGADRCIATYAAAARSRVG